MNEALIIEVGKKYLLDKTHPNKCEVIVLHVGKFYALVKDPRDNHTWEVMKNRLSNLEG